MMITRIAPLILVFLALISCNSAALNTVISKACGLETPQLHVTAEPGAPQRQLGLLNRGVKFMIMQTEILEDVEIWAVSDGPQVFIKDGMIIGTRGFGPDLMSAQAPSLATIKALRDHSRVYNELDGTDRLITQSFTCSVETSSNTATQLTLDEVCRNAETVLRNRFVFDGNSNLLASKQWISTDGGFAIIE